MKPVLPGLAGVIFLAAMALLTGCEDRFRYPCQNPANVGIADCKPPICTATQTCPEQLTKPEELK